MTELDIQNGEPTEKGWDPTERNKYLLRLPALLDIYDKIPLSRPGGYDSLAAVRAEKRATTAFESACGACILGKVCNIKSVAAWRTEHPITAVAQLREALQARPGQAC